MRKVSDPEPSSLYILGAEAPEQNLIKQTINVDAQTYSAAYPILKHKASLRASQEWALSCVSTWWTRCRRHALPQRCGWCDALRKNRYQFGRASFTLCKKKKSANLQTIKQVGFRGQRQTYITELDHPDLSQFTDATVGRFWLEEELSQRHLFTSEEFPHVAEGRERSAPQNPWKLNDDFVC